MSLVAGSGFGVSVSHDSTGVFGSTVSGVLAGGVSVSIGRLP